MKKALITFFIFLVLISAGEAQNGNEPDWRQQPYQRFSPSMVAIIIVLIAALFFMGFFSIYIRNRSFGAPGTIRVLRSSFQRRAATASGLDREVIATFPTFQFSEVKELRMGKEALECAVCLNEFEEEDILRLLPKCDHVFHPECIDEWLSSHVTCPVCRANLVPETEEVPQAGNVGQGEISIQVHENEMAEAGQSQPLPPRFVDGRSKSTNVDRPPRSASVRSGRGKLPKSHSTGNSLIQLGENVDRFTLRFQDECHRQVMMNRALNRTTSCYVTTLPRESSSRSGYRTGFGGRSRSTRVGRSNSRPSDRWVFSMAPPFFTRTASVRSDTVFAAQGDATASSSGLPSRAFIKLPSLQRRDVKGDGMNSTLLPF